MLLNIFIFQTLFKQWNPQCQRSMTNKLRTYKNTPMNSTQNDSKSNYTYEWWSFHKQRNTLSSLHFESVLYFCCIPKKSNHFSNWPESAVWLRTHSQAQTHTSLLYSAMNCMQRGYFRVLYFGPHWSTFCLPIVLFLSSSLPQSLCVHLSPTLF